MFKRHVYEISLCPMKNCMKTTIVKRSSPSLIRPIYCGYTSSFVVLELSKISNSCRCIQTKSKIKDLVFERAAKVVNVYAIWC